MRSVLRFLIQSHQSLSFFKELTELVFKSFMHVSVYAALEVTDDM